MNALDTNVMQSSSPYVYNKTDGPGFLKGFIIDSNFSEKGKDMQLIQTLFDTREGIYLALVIRERSWYR